MAKLAVWRIDTSQGDGDSQQSNPQRVRRSQIGLERHLEDWIVNDFTLRQRLSGVDCNAREISTNVTTKQLE